MRGKSYIAGILSVISGGFGILWLAGAWLYIYMFRLMFSTVPDDPFAGMFIPLMSAIYLSYGIVGAILGTLGIVGGVFAAKRRHWGWALAGAIAGVITFFPTGVAAIIILSMAKEEFQPSQPTIPQGQS